MANERKDIGDLINISKPSHEENNATVPETNIPAKDAFAPCPPKEAIFHRKDEPITLGELNSSVSSECGDQTGFSLRNLGTDITGTSGDRIHSNDGTSEKNSPRMIVRGDWVATTWGKFILIVLMIAAIVGGIYFEIKIWHESPVFGLFFAIMILTILDVIRVGLMMGDDSYYRYPGNYWWFHRWWRHYWWRRF
jgi:hypothetical protein